MDYTAEQQAWADHLFALLDRLSECKANQDLHMSKALEFKQLMNEQWKEFYKCKEEIQQLERQLKSYKEKRPICPDTPQKRRRPNPK